MTPASGRTATKPSLGVFGLTGCAGDQLVLLDCEEQLLDLFDMVEVRDFAMASSASDDRPLDIALVEGAVVTPEDEALVRRVRERATRLVAIGTCAVWGGVPALPASETRAQLMHMVYGDIAVAYGALAVRAVRDVVTVDAEITGCPIERHELLDGLASLLAGNVPQLPAYAVCTECRIAENRCVLTEDAVACLGPLTRAGCRARCLLAGVACIGCRGPAADANVASATFLYETLGYEMADIKARLGMFGARRPVPLPDGDARARP